VQRTKVLALHGEMTVPLHFAGSSVMLSLVVDIDLRARENSTDVDVQLILVTHFGGVNAQRDVGAGWYSTSGVSCVLPEVQRIRRPDFGHSMPDTRLVGSNSKSYVLGAPWAPLCTA
jgi:hypothetical protein